MIFVHNRVEIYNNYKLVFHHYAYLNLWPKKNSYYTIIWCKFKDAIQVHSHFTYNILLYAAVWWVLSKHDSSSEIGNTLCICTIISEIH